MVCAFIIRGPGVETQRVLPGTEDALERHVVDEMLPNTEVEARKGGEGGVARPVHVSRGFDLRLRDIVGGGALHCADGGGRRSLV